jgi:hypothetical protein
MDQVMKMESMEDITILESEEESDMKEEAVTSLQVSLKYQPHP